MALVTRIVLGLLAGLHVVTMLVTPRRDRAKVYAHTCRALCALAIGILAMSGPAPDPIPQLAHDLVSVGGQHGSDQP